MWARAVVFLAGMALMQPAFAAGGVEFPARKSGYWQITMVHKAPEGAPDTIIHACIDEASDKQMMQTGLSMASGMCEKNDMKREGEAIVINAVCTMGPMTTVSRSVISGDFQSEYTVQVTGTVDGMPAIAGGGDEPTATAMTQTAKWLAAKCPDGVKPGDMQMPGGMTVNTNDIFGQGATPPEK